jgi:hypothetical protein
MNCQWVQQNLSAYIDNELPLEQKELVDSHLSQCSLCKAEFDSLLMAWNALSLWDDRHPPLQLKESILKAVKKEKTFNFMRILLPVAAVFVIALSIVFFYRVLGNHDQGALITDQREIQSPVSVESVMVDDNEIIKNLQLLEEKDFYETVEVLKTIDYLPLIEDRMDQKSSMGYYAA